MATKRRKLQAKLVLLSESQRRPYNRHMRVPCAVEEFAMSDKRTVLYVVIAVLVVAVGALGYNLYQAKKQPEGLQINVGPNGLKIENK